MKLLSEKRAPKIPSDADQRLGAAVRGRRIAARMSQGTLGRVVGVSFQQMQKYERGANRISSTRLAGIASALGTDAASLLTAAGIVDGPSPLDGASLDPDVLEFGRLLPQIPSDLRKVLLEMARALAHYPRQSREQPPLLKGERSEVS